MFNKLYSDLSNIELIEVITLGDAKSIWFIDREKEFWVVEIGDDGTLWWRSDFFNDTIYLFSLTDDEFELVLLEWVKEVMRNRFFNFYSSNGYELNHKGEWCQKLSIQDLKYSNMIMDIKKRDCSVYPKVPFKYLEFITKDCYDFLKPKINRTMPDDNSLSDTIHDIITNC